LTRLWRRTSIPLTAGFLTFAILAAACTSTGNGADSTPGASTVATSPTPPTVESTTTTERPTTTIPGVFKPQGGTVVTAIAEEPQTLNSFLPGGDTLVVRNLSNAYARGVRRVNGFDQTYEPDLVTELPTVANGGIVVNDDGTMTVNYTIRPEAVWSDLTPVSGADFEFTYDTIMDEELPIEKAIYEDIISTEFGEKSFSYTMATPTTQHELLFSEIIPKHAVEGTDFVTDWNLERWPSNGPFMFGEWVPGASITLVANPSYYRTDPDTGQALPYLDELVFEIIPSVEDMVTAFSVRSLDVIQPNADVDLIATLQDLESDGVMVEVLAGPLWEHLHFQFGPNNRNPDSLNRYLDFRKAIAFAIDRDQIVADVLGGQGSTLNSWIAPYNPDIALGSWDQYVYDPEVARQYLDAACAAAGRDCVADPVTVIFTTTTTNVFATTSGNARELGDARLAEYLGAIGIVYESDLEDSQLFFGETRPGGTWDFGEWAYNGRPGFSGLVGQLDVWDPASPCPTGRNCYQWGTEGSFVVDDATNRFAELYQEAISTVDEERLVATIQESEQILADQVVILPLYARLSVAAIWDDEIGGFKHNPTPQGYTWNVEFWFRADDL